MCKIANDVNRPRAHSIHIFSFKQKYLSRYTWGAIKAVNFLVWRSTIHVLVKQALVLTRISTPVKRKRKSLDLLQCQYPQYLSPLPGKGKVWLSKRQVHICHIYNHSLTMEQCIKLSELNLQQLTEFVPEPFAKLCYLKFEFPQLNTSDFF